MFNVIFYPFYKALDINKSQMKETEEKINDKFVLYLLMPFLGQMFYNHFLNPLIKNIIIVRVINLKKRT
jgi:hypothetical protein